MQTEDGPRAGEWNAPVSTATWQSFVSPPVAVADPIPRARDDLRGGGLALLGFAGALALAIVFECVAVLLGASSRSVTVDVVGHVGLWTGLFAGAYIVTHRQPDGSLRDIGFRTPTGAELAFGVSVALVAIVVESQVIQALQRALPQDNSGVRNNLFVGARPSLAAIVVIALLVCVGAPFFEELFFRGVVQSILTQRVGAIPALVIQAALFGCAHFQIGMTARQALLRIVAVTIVGLFLGWLRHHTGRLAAGMVAHAVNNAIVVGLTFIMLYAR